MRYLMIFSYDGTNYSGYQVQPNKLTVEKNIEDKLTMINGNKNVKICATGRTDAKVHAINQMAHFDLINDLNPEKLRISLNKLINDDIYIKKIKIVNDDFHARFSVKKKEYVYILNMGEYDPIQKNYVYQYNKSLDINEMKTAINCFLGEHDFRSFTKIDDKPDNFIRTIYKATIEVKNEKIYFTFVGNGFLRYMVRNMVGTLINVGEHKIKSKDLPDIINAKDRRKAGITAPPNGLYLNNIYY